MNQTLSPIAANARLEAATETLAEYIGYLLSEITAERDQPEPNMGRIEALEQQREKLLQERRAITPEDQALITGPCMSMRPCSRQPARDGHGEDPLQSALSQ